ncbi:MAG TPA: metal-sensing transcriptional repressor [Candidatus Woesebacteria bacterium]|nr:metal-sensing transcriptional repressor [Candidatus Woesebacteria bacterium]
MVTIKSNKDRIVHRLKIANGHLHKIIQMVESDEYCIDVLHHSLAVQKALKQIDMLMMEDHLKTCAIDQIKNGEETKMVSDLLGIYKFK